MSGDITKRGPLLKLVTPLLLLTLFAGVTSSPKAALRPGYYDLGHGQGVLVLPSAKAAEFGHDLEIAATSYSGVAAIVATVANWTIAGRIAWVSTAFIMYVPAWRIEWAANRGAPVVYIYLIWGGLAVWADPVW